MKTKRFFAPTLFVATVGISLSLLSANASAEEAVFDLDEFGTTVSNEGTPTGSGTLEVGVVLDSPFEGVFNYILSSSGPDGTITSYFDEPLLTLDENMQYSNDGAMHYAFDEENNEITFTIAEEVYWHDGERLDIHDYVESFYVMGHPDYNGVYGRSSGFTLIEGYLDYHNGGSDEISGIEVIDDNTAVFTFTETNPTLLSGGLWVYAFPVHHFEHLSVSEMSSSPEARENPIGIGPYKVDSITPGESLILSKHEDYWRGEPQLDGINIQVVSTATVSNEVANNNFDIVEYFPVDQVVDIADAEGLEWLAHTSDNYDYLGFKLGEWDAENNVNVDLRDEMKMGDVELRRAMWYAIDNAEIGRQFYHGLRVGATTLVPPYYEAYHDETIEAPTFDLDTANQILDDAGYEDIDGDGFRETPEGEPLEINLAVISHSDVAEPLANYYLQSWRNVGLNTNLLNGRLVEYNSFYDMLGNDTGDIDVYLGAWQVGSDVDQSGYYGGDSPSNYGRYNDETNNEILARGLSEEAFDPEYRIDVYKEWQQYMVEDIPVIPTLYRTLVFPITENVVNYSIDPYFNEETALYNVGFSEE